MKNVTCRHCGERRPSIISIEGCRCGGEELEFRMSGLAEMVNSRETALMSCGRCRHDLFNLDVAGYFHKNGWNVPGIKERMWLSIECPDCKYETSFDKFGITR